MLLCKLRFFTRAPAKPSRRIHFVRYCVLTGSTAIETSYNSTDFDNKYPLISRSHSQHALASPHTINYLPHTNNADFPTSFQEEYRTNRILRQHSSYNTMRINTLLAASAAILATTRAHMSISSPKPIPGTDSKSPLDPDGSQFPCQGAALPSTGGQSMSAGSEQTLAFDLGGGDNSAVHGGGSCQISITYETDPAKQKDPANWRVIYSIEGGCPTDASGNLESGKVVDCVEGSTDTACVNEFPFTVPGGVKDGHAIMAWTWFNNVSLHIAIVT